LNRESYSPEAIRCDIGNRIEALKFRRALISGTSSGYGLETARHFLANGWNVVAAMRTPNPDVLPRSENLRILPLDVCSDEASPPPARSTFSSTTPASAPSKQPRWRITYPLRHLIHTKLALAQ
jgi:hypothetical protein